MLILSLARLDPGLIVAGKSQDGRCLSRSAQHEFLSRLGDLVGRWTCRDVYEAPGRESLGDGNWAETFLFSL